MIDFNKKNIVGVANLYDELFGLGGILNKLVREFKNKRLTVILINNFILSSQFFK